MNTQLQSFDFNDHALRIFPTDDGASFYAIAKDATDILGYRDATTGLRSVPDKHKGTRSVRTLGGTQEMLCVDESGLYRLILRSDKPEAEPFMDWVTSKVLPSIRKTGSYAEQPSHSHSALLNEIDDLKNELLNLYRARHQAQAVPQNSVAVSGGHRPWTTTQDQELLALKAEGHGWTAIGVKVGRSRENCRYRYNKLMAQQGGV
jgi:prophage antirepressor-like protein